MLPSQTSSNSQKLSSISDAFDSLIDYNDSQSNVQSSQAVSDPFVHELPVQRLSQSITTEASSNNVTEIKSRKRPWIKGTVKSMQMDNSRTDWKNVHFYVKVYASKHLGGNNHASTIVVRLSNESTSLLSDVTFSFEDVDIPTIVGTVGAGETIESSSKQKIGPFLYKDITSTFSNVIKGNLSISGISVPIKFSLPICTLMMPVTNASHKDIMSEFSTRHWYSSSTKIGMRKIEFPQIVQHLANYLKAEVSE